MPPSTKNSRTSYLANRRQPTVRNPPTTPKITLPTTPKINLSTTTPKITLSTSTPKITLSTSTPKITLPTASEPKLTLPSYSTGGFTSDQRNQTQTTVNSNDNNQENFLKNISSNFISHTSNNNNTFKK